MMFGTTRYAALLLAFTICGCASGPKLSEIAGRLPGVPSGYGRVYFYRSGIFGAAVQPAIHVNGNAVGNSEPGGVFYVDRAPGDVEVSCSTEVSRKVCFELGSGETRYVQTAVSMGFFVGHVTPSLVPPRVGAQEIQNKSYTGK